MSLCVDIIRYFWGDQREDKVTDTPKYVEKPEFTDLELKNLTQPGENVTQELEDTDGMKNTGR